MPLLGRQTQRTCQSLSRRSFLQVGASSVVAKALTAKRGSSDLPPFLVVGGKLHQGHKAIIGEGGGPLGAMYDPFRLEYDPAKGVKVPALQLAPDLTPERLTDRQSLMHALGR